MTFYLKGDSKPTRECLPPILFLGAALAALLACGPRKPVEFAPEVGFEKLLQSRQSSIPSLSSLRGNVVVLEFWATWCGPCLEKLPHMNKLVDAFSGQPVRFISVTDESADTVEAFTREHPMKAEIALDPSKKAFRAFGVRGIPEAFIIDPYGRIHLRITPSFLYKLDITKALKASPPPPAAATP